MNAENSTQKAWVKVLKGLAFWALALIVILALFFLMKPLTALEGYGLRAGAAAQSCMIVGIGFCAIYVGYAYFTKTLSVKKLIVLLFIVGCILRVGYMLYTSAATRQQDTYTAYFDGHEAYAWTIFSTSELPTTNEYQFYHPPLNALLQAGFMHVTSWLTQGLTQAFALGEYFPSAFIYGKPEYIDAERWFLYSSCQVLAVLYSLLACVGMLKILKLFDFSDKIKLLVAAIVVLYPRNIQFSGMLNNDGLSFALAIYALYFALKWQKQGRKIWNILLCALCVGLGMMTKLSSATVCLPIAGVFVLEFVDTLKKKENAMRLGKMILQYTLFLCVCAPIGLWFQVYAKIRFDQSFGHVFSNLNDRLYTGDHSFISRFILCLDPMEYFGSLWCRPFDGNYYLFNYALRSSIFGEFIYHQGEGFGVIAVLSAYAVSILLFVALAYIACVWWKSRKTPQPLDGGMVATNAKIISLKDLVFVFLLMQSQVLSETYFYIAMPYGCTMDFRYIMPMILAIALTLGYASKALHSIKTDTATRMGRWLNILTIVFLTSSALFYCVCA